MKDHKIVYSSICSIWSRLYNTTLGKKGISEDNSFLNMNNEKGYWRLVITRTFDMKGKIYLKATIKEAYNVMAYDGVEKILK